MGAEPFCFRSGIALHFHIVREKSDFGALVENPRFRPIRVAFLYADVSVREWLIKRECFAVGTRCRNGAYLCRESRVYGLGSNRRCDDYLVAHSPCDSICERYYFRVLFYGRGEFRPRDLRLTMHLYFAAIHRHQELRPGTIDTFCRIATDKFECEFVLERLACCADLEFCARTHHHYPPCRKGGVHCPRTKRAVHCYCCGPSIRVEHNCFPRRNGDIVTRGRDRTTPCCRVAPVA